MWLMFVLRRWTTQLTSSNSPLPHAEHKPRTPSSTLASCLLQLTASVKAMSSREVVVEGHVEALPDKQPVQVGGIRILL